VLPLPSAPQISPYPDTVIAKPAMRQSWRHVSFVHWRSDPAVVRQLIPRELELDLFDGDCWIGLVPFLIQNLSTPHGPALPWVSHFPETNVRTYVIDGQGRRGVWFFSLDAARWPAVLGARAGFGLPYYWAWMSAVRENDTASYSSVRLTPPGGRSHLRIEIGRFHEPSPLEVFLTARFRLFARLRGRVIMSELTHGRWPLQCARVFEMEQTLIRKAGLQEPESEPLVHFAEGVDVIIGPPVPV
jgi:hypothetical protein